MSTDIARERLTGRIQELYASATLSAAARSEEAVWATSERRGLWRPQLVASSPSGRLCPQWARWSRAGSNHRRCSTQ
jgi:hypothetical protein